MDTKELKEARERAYKLLLNAAKQNVAHDVIFWAESLTFWRKQKIPKKKA